MKSTLSLGAFGHATSLFLAITFGLCVAFDLVFPQVAMYRSWQALLPGFTWISWGSFFLGPVSGSKTGGRLTITAPEPPSSTATGSGTPAAAPLPPAGAGTGAGARRRSGVSTPW